MLSSLYEDVIVVLALYEDNTDLSSHDGTADVNATVQSKIQVHLGHASDSCHKRKEVIASEDSPG